MSGPPAVTRSGIRGLKHGEPRFDKVMDAIPGGENKLSFPALCYYAQLLCTPRYL